MGGDRLDGRHGKATGAVARQAEALGPGGLNRDPVDLDAEHPCEVRPDLVTAGGQVGPFGEDGEVTAGRGQSALGQHPDDVLEQREAPRPRPSRVRGREVLPEVAEPASAEQGVGERMADHVAVGVPGQSGLPFERHPAKEQRPAGVPGVQVDPQTDAYVAHRVLRGEASTPCRASRIASARARSSGDVTFRLSGSPARATTR